MGQKELQKGEQKRIQVAKSRRKTFPRIESYVLHIEKSLTVEPCGWR
jgi:hypothetical protein